MDTNNDLKEILIYTIILQLDILSPDEARNKFKRKNKIEFLKLLSCEELESIIQIYENQINALILKRKKKLLSKLTDPAHYCQN